MLSFQITEVNPSVVLFVNVTQLQMRNQDQAAVSSFEVMIDDFILKCLLIVRETADCPAVGSEGRPIFGSVSEPRRGRKDFFSLLVLCLFSFGSLLCFQKEIVVLD